MGMCLAIMLPYALLLASDEEVPGKIRSWYAESMNLLMNIQTK